MVSSTVEHTRFEEQGNLLLRTTPLHCLIAVEVIQLPDSFQCLSPREKQICFYLSRALSNQEIATELNSARKTIENQLTSIYRKLGIRSRTMLLHLINSTR